MTHGELVALPLTVDLITAGRAFGLGRTTSHTLVRRDEFPVKVMKVGKTYRVLRADLLRALGVEVDS